MSSRFVRPKDDSLLRKLRRRKLYRVRAAGADALVAFASEGSVSQPVFQAMTYVAHEQRLYPTKGGYLLRWPFQGQFYDPDVFRVEPAGWDHEHCSSCSARIGVGVGCWITKHGSFYLIREACYRRLKKLARV